MNATANNFLAPDSFCTPIDNPRAEKAPHNFDAEGTIILGGNSLLIPDSLAAVIEQRQISEYDSWTPNEIHAGRITDTYWYIQTKLPNGRVPGIFKTMPTPTEKDEPQLITKDKKDRLKEWFQRVWQKLTRCHFCQCDNDY